MPNIYYEPKEFGVKLLEEFDLSDGCYQFDYVVLWQSLEDPRVLYIGKDAGCSCPSPFEDVRSLAELERVNPNDPEPQIRSAFELDQHNYTHSAAALLQGVSDMVRAARSAVA